MNLIVFIKHAMYIYKKVILIKQGFNLVFSFSMLDSIKSSESI